MLGIPFKRGAHVAPVEYLETVEVEALLAVIDRSTPSGRRDYALFALMSIPAPGAGDPGPAGPRPRLEPPCQVRLHGKGNKVRLCPIWPRTAHLLQEIIMSRHIEGEDLADQPVFVNRRDAAMTRFGVRYLLRKHLAAAARTVPSLADKRIHPHSLRHTTAIHLLKAGVDFATISQWLGHANLNTTMRYAPADLDVKRQALAQVFPKCLHHPRAAPLPSTASISQAGCGTCEAMRMLCEVHQGTKPSKGRSVYPWSGYFT